MAKVRDKAAERIVASVGVVKIPIAKTVVELNVLGSKGKMRAKERFDMEERGLRGEAGSGGFVINLADGCDFGGGNVADGRENCFDSAGCREPGG